MSGHITPPVVDYFLIPAGTQVFLFLNDIPERSILGWKTQET